MLHKALIIKFLFLRLRVDLRDTNILNKMAFLHFKKKEAPTGMDAMNLDVPPEPPKMGKEEQISEEPINEELMTPAKTMKAPEPKEMPELPPLPAEGDIGSLPDLPDLPEEPPPDMGADLPPPPEIKEKKQGFFSFLKSKKTPKDLELPKIEEGTDMPPLPDIKGQDMPELPDIRGEELPDMPELTETEPEAPPETAPKEMPKIPETPVLPPVEEVKERPAKKFVSINEFRDIQSNIADIKDILKGVDGVFAKVEEVKADGDSEYVGLYNKLKDAHTKIMFVDKALFKEESA